MQELIGKSVKRNITIRQNVAKALEYFKEILWAVLVVLLVTGIFSDWMNYEVFAAFYVRPGILCSHHHGNSLYAAFYGDYAAILPIRMPYGNIIAYFSK
jgi:hypothetical protein